MRGRIKGRKIRRRRGVRLKMAGAVEVSQGERKCKSEWYKKMEGRLR